MTHGYLDIAVTPSVRAAQHGNGAQVWEEGGEGHRAVDRLGDAERQFIARRDSFYMATVSETGWPYMQHRGGPPGFLRVLDDQTLGFADYRGNRQYLSLGNLNADGRAALFLMDYPNRRRLKIFAHIEAKDLAAEPELAARVASPGYKGRAERAMLIHLDAFSWNCPQHITPRFTEAELAPVLDQARSRIQALEAENAALQARLDTQGV